ncbi:MAG: dNTP triphosphohydrolase, partial [Methanosarcinaceae archaeon]|nr:dNTP triphosphohydrolase [Methanosarcinaceae archaeon]
MKDRKAVAYGKNYELDPLATPDEGPHVWRKHSDKKEESEKEYAIATRTAFQRDKDRILYSKAFRRLIHKTQVCFTGEMNEHIRTRLTHTLEVSQIARSISRQVHANEDLAEAIALGHDLGHTPFGHTGEKVLNDFLSGTDEGIKKKLQDKYEFDISKMELHFKHNFQSIRVLNELEEGYEDFKGLNLTDPVLEGILKHTSTKFKEGKLKGKPIIYEGI